MNATAHHFYFFLRSITVHLGVQNLMWHFHMCVYNQFVVLNYNVLTQCFLPHNAKLLWCSIHCGMSDKHIGVMPGCHLVSGGSVSSVCMWGMLLAWAAYMSSTHLSFLVCACEGTGALTLRGQCCEVVRVWDPTSAQAGWYRSRPRCIAPLLPDLGECWQRPSHTGSMIVKLGDMVEG